MRLFPWHKMDSRKAQITADKRYDQLMDYYTKKYGNLVGFANVREQLAYAIADEVFYNSPYTTAGHYYRAATIAFNSECKKLADELLDRSIEAYRRWETLFPERGSGYFVKGEMEKLRSAIRK